jgi:hypothetical protein
MSDSSMYLQPKACSLPTTIQRTLTTNTTSTHTDLLLQLYADRIFVVISQYCGKIGSLLQATMENSIIDNSHTYDVVSLLGSKREDPILELYARHILDMIVSRPCDQSTQLLGNYTSKRRYLLLGVSLQDRSQELFQEIVKEVMSMYNEAISLPLSY